MDPLTRRTLFQNSAFGLGGGALASLLGAGDAPGAVRHHAARAKSVIYIHLVGAPSHLDLFDYKPELQRRSGELCPDEFFEGKQLAFIREQPNLLGTPAGSDRFAFRRCGESGHTISNLMPHLQGVADELCFIRSLHTDQFNHAPAQMFSLTGFSRFGRPSIGSWVSYGLGSENRDLPAFVVLVTGQVLGAGNSAWGSGFLPTRHQGIEFRSQGDPVLFLSNPRGVGPEDRRGAVDTVNALNALQLADVGDPEIATRISQYEMAYRMQTSVPELMDIASESEATHALYGTRPGATSFANNCLLARRMVERGVRFVQIYSDQAPSAESPATGGIGHDRQLGPTTRARPRLIDRPVAALIKPTCGSGGCWRTPSSSGHLRVRAHPLHPGLPREQLRADSRPAGTTTPRASPYGWPGAGPEAGDRPYGATDEVGWKAAVEPGRPCARLPRHRPPPPRHRPRAAHLPLPGQAVPPHRRPREGRPQRSRLIERWPEGGQKHPEI